MKNNIFPFCLVLFHTATVAQAPTILDSPATSAVITGRISDKAFYDDTLGVNFWSRYVYGATKGGSVELQVKIDSKGIFKIQLPRFSQPARIRVYNKKNAVIFFDFQLVEPGDKISARIVMKNSTPSMIFKGKGCVKYAAWAKVVELDKQGFYYHDDAAQMRRERDSVIQLRSKVLDRFRLTKKIKEILKTDITCQELARLCRSIYALDSNARIGWKSFEANRLIEDVDTTWLETKLLSKYFIEYIFELHKVHLYLKQGNTHSFMTLYNRICSTYNGLLRDKLLLYLFSDKLTIANMGGVDEIDFLNCIKDAYANVGDQWIKNMLRQKINTEVRGAYVYPFSFQDSAGNIITSKSLLGKVILIDIWGNPCTACLQFKQAFERDVYPTVKHRKDFVVLSVNTDEKRGDWIQGLAKYSRPEFINVNTGGFGKAHPMLYYYNTTGLPTLLLIGKDGKLISSTIPLPHFKKSEQLIKLLMSELNKSPNPTKKISITD